MHKSITITLTFVLLLMLGASYAAAQCPLGSPGYDYRIVVKTGWGDGDGGTNANVFITLMGVEKIKIPIPWPPHFITISTPMNSGERQLDSNDNDFERNSVGTYSIHTCKSLGDLRNARIRHDNTGEKPGWFLDYITVHEEQTDRMWFFPCNRWLAVDADDHLIDRTLDAN
jgi:hypothetical protein